MGYTKHAIKGFGWNSLLKIGTAGVVALKYAFLGHFALISPHDFGLFSYVVVALGVMEALTETGINVTILQSKKNLTYFVDTAWVISLLRGFLISILMICIGFFMQSYFNEPDLLVLVAVASFVPIVRGIINPAIISLQKELRFFRDSVFRFLLLVVEALAAVVLAFAMKSVYALILSIILSALVEVGLSFVLFTIKPKFNYLPSRAKEIFQNAGGLNLSAILSYLVFNLDNLLVGKVLGTSSLGLYAMGYSTSHRFTLEFAKSVQYATLPVYVQIVDQRRRLRTAFWKSTVSSMIMLVAIALPFIFFPHFIIRLWLGPEWLQVADIWPLMIAAGLVQSFISLSMPVFTAKKEYVWMNSAHLVNLLCLIPLVSFFGSSFGLIGAVYGLLLARIAAIPVTLLGLWQSFTRNLN